jgi:hypothetical protein
MLGGGERPLPRRRAGLEISRGMFFFSAFLVTTVRKWLGDYHPKIPSAS